MVYHERAAWTELVVGIAGVVVYAILLSVSAAGGPLTGVDWPPLMIGTIGGGVLLAILLTIGWGILARARDREAMATDIRDRDIGWMGGRVEHAFLVIAGVGVLVLCALRADVFWIAHVMFAGFAVSSILGGVARVIAYRRGLV